MKALVTLVLCLAVVLGVEAGATRLTSSNRKLQQWYPPPSTASCYKITEAQMTTGKLCISQLIMSNTTKVVCSEYRPECMKTVQESRILVPRGNAQTNPQEFNLSNEAACKLLGYRAMGSGSIHVTGDNAAAKATCWNGQDWIQDNWWSTLVCCA